MPSPTADPVTDARVAAGFDVGEEPHVMVGDAVDVSLPVLMVL